MNLNKIDEKNSKRVFQRNCHSDLEKKGKKWFHKKIQWIPKVNSEGICNQIVTGI